MLISIHVRWRYHTTASKTYSKLYFSFASYIVQALLKVVSSTSIPGASAAPRVIRAPAIEDLPQLNVDWNEGPFISSRWFLACRLGGNNIVCVHIKDTELWKDLQLKMHMDRELHTYPSSRCYVYARKCSVLTLRRKNG